jgi:four helix bundle protein
MASGNLTEFTAYMKALELFDLVVDDMDSFVTDRKLERLVSQQLASVDSVCSNIEEGYGRESSKEYRRYLIIARGSARETRGRYRRLRRWIPADIVKARMELADEVISILNPTIESLGKRAN